MPKRKIIIEPDYTEKKVSLEKVDDELKKLMDDMLETMYSALKFGCCAGSVLKRLL